MNRGKSADGYRTVIINVRLTDKEADKLQEMYDAEKKLVGGSMLKADYIRKQLLHENDSARLKCIAHELKQIRADLNQAGRRMERIGDEAAYQYFLELVDKYSNVIKDKM